MQLNKSDKQSVVRAIMDDVPKVDFDAEFKSLVQTYWDQWALPEVKSLVRNRHTDQLNKQYWSLLWAGCSICTYGEITLSPGELAQYNSERKRLNELCKQQKEKLDNIKTSLEGVVNSCRTLKQLKDRLPEFEKYFPKERVTVTPNLPVANLIADLQAAGWPKDQTK